MKRCFKCRSKKPLSDFYKHPKMGDGYLGKCKECTKNDVAVHRGQNLKKIREYDRGRGQDPRRKACNRRNYIKRTSTPEGRKREWSIKGKRSKSRSGLLKRAASVMCCNALRDGRIKRPDECQKCGSKTKLNGHHEDYYAPLDVVWLCRPCHGKRHREINQALRDGEDWTDRGW